MSHGDMGMSGRDMVSNSYVKVVVSRSRSLEKEANVRLVLGINF